MDHKKLVDFFEQRILQASFMFITKMIWHMLINTPDNLQHSVLKPVHCSSRNRHQLWNPSHDYVKFDKCE